VNLTLAALNHARGKLDYPREAPPGGAAVTLANTDDVAHELVLERALANSALPTAMHNAVPSTDSCPHRVENDRSNRRPRPCS
jgi:hypothetical protein